MAKEIHKGDSPKNARIKINYSGKKPTVSFSYPSKNGVEGSMVFPIFVVVILIIGGIYGLNISIKETEEVSFNRGRYYECLDSINRTYRHLCYDIHIARPKLDNLLTDLITMFILFLLAIAVTIFIYIPNKKYWQNLYPKYQAWRASKKMKIFKLEDIKYTKEFGYYCELPVFTNIILNFEATKDFSKYLKEFEIEEHKFKYYQERRKKKSKMRKKKRDKSINEWLWYARFYFSAKPKTGKLEVLFK